MLVVQEKKAQEDHINDIHTVVSKAVNTLGPARSTAYNTLTENKILEIIKPLLTPKSTSGTYSLNDILSIINIHTDTDQPNHLEDIEMETAPPSAAEIASNLLVEIQNHSMNSM